MKHRDVPLYPFLLAAYPILQLSAENVEWLVSWKDLGISVAMSLIVAGLGFVLVPRFLGHRRSEATILWVLFWLWYGIFVQLLVRLTGRPALFLYSFALPLWILVIVAGGAVFRPRDWLKRAKPFLNLFSVFLLLFPIIAHLRGSSTRLPPTDSANLLSHRVVAPPESLPDIYFLILDGYSGTQSLAQVRNYDNRPFEDSLRQRDFVVPNRSRANYIHTHLSLASMLNWTHLLNLKSVAGDGHDRSLTHNMIEDNRAARFLRTLGYEFVFFPTTFPATVRNRLADRQIPEPPLRESNLHLIWFWQSAAAPLIPLLCWAVDCQPKRFPYPPETTQEFEAKFTRLAALAEEPGPKFVLAHLLLPHPPFIFQADCTPRDPIWPVSGDPTAQSGERSSYLDQIDCLNRMLLPLIDQILEGSDPSPIIILQADHGSGRIHLDPLTGETIPLEELDQVQIDDRSYLFAAYHLPEGGGALVYDSITPVNILPLVFNHYFGTDIQPLEDATYWSEYRQSYVFTRIQTRSSNPRQ